MKIVLWINILAAAVLAVFAVPGQTAPRYWVAEKSGRWSDAANWSSAYGAAAGASIPGPRDVAIFNAKPAGDSIVDLAFAGEVGGVVISPGYRGTITQVRHLTVTGDMKIAGGSRNGWTFAEDTPADLTVEGNLTLMSGCFITCTRSSTKGEGEGRVITIGKNLKVLGIMTADGKGFMQGPGTPALPMAKDDPKALEMVDRYVGGANVEAVKNAAPVSPAGPGHGGRGAGIYRNPNGQYTVTPHSYYWTEPLGSGIWRYPGGGTYGSITAPTSLGSGTKAINFDPKAPRKYDPQNRFWQYTGAYGGGAIKLIVAGTATVSGAITANGALAGETGASGGSVYIIAGKISGDGVIRANGSDGPGIGHGRGGGGGGRVAVLLRIGSALGNVMLQAYGGEGRWSPNAAAGTIYLETPKDRAGGGTLVVDNRNSPCRSMYDICTSVSDSGGKSYSLRKIVIRNHGILYVGRGSSINASGVSGENGNIVVEGKFNCAGRIVGLKSKEYTRPQDEVTRGLRNPVTVLTLGPAYGMKQELLNRCCQVAFYPYLNKLIVAADLSTLAYPDDCKGVKMAECSVMSPRGSVGTFRMVFNDKRYAEGTITPAKFEDGTYSVTVKLDNGLTTSPIFFKRERQPWERNSLGVTDKIYYPFEPLSVENNSVKLSSQRIYTMNGFGLFDKIVSEGKEISSGPMTLKLETAGGLAEWKFDAGKFDTIKPNIAEYSAGANCGALSVKTKSSVEFDGCTRVEMDLLPGARPEEVKRMWIEIPLRDKEVPLFHYTQFNGGRWNYAGRTPRGGKVVWEPSLAQWKDRRPPLWSIQSGTEGQDDGLVWDSTNARNVDFISITPFVPYIWLGGAERGLAWFADSDKGWIPGSGKPAQVITREGDRLAMRVYLINKPTTVTEDHHIVFGLQASPTRPMMKDWRTVDRFAMWGYMTVPFGMWCCSKYPIDHDYDLLDKAIQNGKDNASGKPVSPKFVYDKVEQLKAKGWPDDMTPQAFIDTWVLHPWNNICKVGPLSSIYFEEHWTDPGQTDMDTYGDEWSAREFTGYWSIKEKNRVVYDSPYMTSTNKTGPFTSGDYSQSLVDFSVYYANEILKRGISLYFDTTYPHTSYDPNVSDAYVTDDGRIQPSVQIWNQRDYYRRIWNLTNQYNEKGANPPLWYSQHTTNTFLLPWNTWTTCNLDNEATWTDVGRGITPAVFPWDYLLTETAGRQVGVPAHSHFPVCGDRENVRREWGMRRVHEITITRQPGTAYDWPKNLDKTFLDFGYGTDEVDVVNYWSDDAPFIASNSEVKWIGMTRKNSSTAMILLQSYCFGPTTTKVSLPGRRVWVNAETREELPVGADGSVEVVFKEGYGTLLLITSENADRTAR